MPVKVFGEGKILKFSLVPGSTPLLLSRGLLADWGVVQDFRHARVRLLDHGENLLANGGTEPKGTLLVRLVEGLPSSVRYGVY